MLRCTMQAAHYTIAANTGFVGKKAQRHCAGTNLNPVRAVTRTQLVQGKLAWRKLDAMSLRATPPRSMNVSTVSADNFFQLRPAAQLDSVPAI
jgi:hypothetical protein